MTGRILNSILLAGMICAIALIASANAFAADISDGASLFSADALAKANQAIHDIEKKTGHEIRIETHSTIPDGKAEVVIKMTKSERDSFVSNWVHERASATKAHGLFVLICKDPALVRLWAKDSLMQAGFGESQARPIRETLIAGFIKSKDYDPALTNLVAQLTTSVGGLKPARHGATSAHTAPVRHRNMESGQQHEGVHHSGGLIWVMVIILGGVFAFSMITRLFSGGGYGPGMGYGYGGGGFMRSLAGGIFGAMAGNWIYDQFSGHHAQASDRTWSNTDPSANGDGDAGGFQDSQDGGGGTDFGGGDMDGSDFGGGGDFGGGDDY